MSIYEKRGNRGKTAVFRSMMHSFVSLLIVFMPKNSVYSYFSCYNAAGGDLPIYTGKTINCYK